jgi:hypothetical protein
MTKTYTRDPLTVAQFVVHTGVIKIPDGFTATMALDVNHGVSQMVFTLASENVIIRFDQSGCGHTEYKFGAGWRTFDRRGIEDSFYHLPLYPGHEIEPLDEIVTKQLTRVAEMIEYHKTAMPVPGLPFSVSPARLRVLKTDIANKGWVIFVPAGMGTGYRVSRKVSTYSTRATPELEAFLGVSPLYVSTFDHD